MWQPVHSKVPEDISVDDFFITLVPNHFKHVENLFQPADGSFLNGSVLKIQFDIEGKIYSLTLKNGKTLDVARGALDKPHVMITVSEKDWRKAVIKKFNEPEDQFTGQPTVYMDIKHCKTLMSMNGRIDIHLKRQDNTSLPIGVIFNGEENPSVTVHLDIPDAIRLMNRSATGLGLLMDGKLKFSGSILLLMKLQYLIQGIAGLDSFDIRE